MAAKLINVKIEHEMKESYLSYAMSVIVGRALPDVRDGLKPVHRRVLYAMHELSNVYGKPYKKSARIVGDVIGKYHPHGDVAVYDTIVRMAQDFSMRYQLVDGQGNFGSIDGDNAAAMRYTEIRMAKITDEMLSDLEKETVDWGPNYDETLKEPLLLPARIPNLLINGSSGIAVGMATNIPPHNLSEVVDGLLYLIDKPLATDEEIIGIIPAPDFPTGGFIYGREGIESAYKTGKGVITMRAKAKVEEMKGGREAIIITEVPYQTNKARMIERIAELVRDKKLQGISDLRDESNREGIRVVIELKKDAISDVILNQLYKNSGLEESFGITMLAIVDKQPKIISLKEALTLFLQHRKDVVTKRTRYELRKAQERVHVLDGLLIALNNLDKVIQIIKSSKESESARQKLQKEFKLSEIQAQAILDMRLARLTGLEREKIVEEHKNLLSMIKRYEEILASEKELFGVIKAELKEIKEKYGDERKTKIIKRTKDLQIEDLIQDEEMVVTISHQGYIKRNTTKLYRSQGRGGRGVAGMDTKEEDFVKDIFVATMHNYMLFFTNRGKLHWLRVHEIPEGSRQARGKPIVNLLQLKNEEKVSAVLPVIKFEEGEYIVMVTAKGTIKKTDIMAFSNLRAGGIIAINIDEGDSLVGAALTDGKHEILLSTALGQAIRFSEEDVRSMGRTAQGVRGINLEQGDIVVGMEIIGKEEGKSTLLTVTENGYGKRSEIEEYRLQSRGGKGIITIKTTDRNGRAVSVNKVTDSDELMLITTLGTLIRIKAAQVSVIGRNTQGVRLIKVAQGEKVVAVEVVREGTEENGATEETKEIKKEEIIPPPA